MLWPIVLIKIKINPPSVNLLRVSLIRSQTSLLLPSLRRRKINFWLMLQNRLQEEIVHLHLVHLRPLPLLLGRLVVFLLLLHLLLLQQPFLLLLHPNRLEPLSHRLLPLQVSLHLLPQVPLDHKILEGLERQQAELPSADLVHQINLHLPLLPQRPLLSQHQLLHCLLKHLLVDREGL